VITGSTQSLFPKDTGSQESHNLLLVERLFDSYLFINLKRLCGKTKGMSAIAGAHQQMCSIGGSSLHRKDVERLSVIWEQKWAAQLHINTTNCLRAADNSSLTAEPTHIPLVKFGA